MKLLRAAIIPLIATCLLEAQTPASKVNAETGAPDADKAVGSANSTPGIPTFYAHSGQVIVEAEVWKPVDKKNANISWVPQSALEGLPNGGTEVRKLLKQMPPPAPGLAATDFHVFDNGAEQSINYFKEADFAAIGSTLRWLLYPTTHGIWGILEPGGPGMGRFLRRLTRSAMFLHRCSPVNVIRYKWSRKITTFC